MWRQVITPRTRKAKAGPRSHAPGSLESDSAHPRRSTHDPLTPIAVPKRFFSLDALRGIAALAVVFWHWQHFFYHGTVRGEFAKLRQPFYQVFFLFYDKGWMAVDLFFCLSGFIFFWLYSERIASRGMKLSDFWLLRLSRLYPLHLATLVFVALAQWLMRRETGEFFVYPLNDAYHFGLNLLFISGWRTSFGDSFNAPVWSVSVEMFLYAAFFALCLAGRPGWVRLLPLIVAGAFLKFHIPIGRGVYGFFLGGAAYICYETLFRRQLVNQAIKLLAVGVIVGWILVLVEVKLGVLASVASDGVVDISQVGNLLATGLLMPMTILLLALVETVKHGLGKKLSFLGDISYSSYLLHFPLQLVIAALVGALGVGSTFFYTRASLVGFFLLLIVMSLLTYNYFERPMQQRIRRWWGGARSSWGTTKRRSPQADAGPLGS